MAAFAVTGDQYREIDRKMLDIKRQLNGKAGSPFDPERVKRALQAIVEGDFDEAKALKPKIDYVHGLFAPIDEQVRKVRLWNNRYGWGFSDQQIDEAAKSAPNWPDKEGDKLVAVVLVPYLGDEKDAEGKVIMTGLQRTFDELWTIAAKRQKSYWRKEALLSDPDHLRLLDGIAYPGKCLRWEVIDLGANRNKAPKVIRNIKSPHQGVLAAVAHHPRWVRSMDGDEIPFVRLPGLQSREDSGEWLFVPFVHFSQSNRQVFLHHYWDHNINQYHAVPTFCKE